MTHQATSAHEKRKRNENDESSEKNQQSSGETEGMAKITSGNVDVLRAHRALRA